MHRDIRSSKLARSNSWLSIAAGELACGPAAARLAALFKAPLDVDRAQHTARMLFGVMNQALSQCAYLTGDSPTLADIALYSYSAHAPEGGIKLDGFPHVLTWLQKIERLPGFVPMPGVMDPIE